MFWLANTDLPLLYSVPSDHFPVQIFSPIQMFSFKDVSPRLKVKTCILHLVYRSTFFPDLVLSWCETTQLIQTGCHLIVWEGSVMISFIHHRILTCRGNPRHVHAHRSSEYLPDSHYFAGRNSDNLTLWKKRLIPTKLGRNICYHRL